MEKVMRSWTPIHVEPQGKKYTVCDIVYSQKMERERERERWEGEQENCIAYLKQMNKLDL